MFYDFPIFFNFGLIKCHEAHKKSALFIPPRLFPSWIGETLRYSTEKSWTASRLRCEATNRHPVKPFWKAYRHGCECMESALKANLRCVGLSSVGLGWADLYGDCLMNGSCLIALEAKIGCRFHVRSIHFIHLLIFFFEISPQTLIFAGNYQTTHDLPFHHRNDP